jgi:hypothetical protein
MDTQGFNGGTTLKKTYLGDGVYAEYQECSDTVCIFTERSDGTHYLHLDAGMCDELVLKLKMWREASRDVQEFLNFRMATVKGE